MSQHEGSGGEEGSMRFRYSPAVQTLATEHQIDLSRVQGSGMGGRITRKDVLAYIEREERPKAKALLPERHQSRAPKHRKKRYSLAGLRRFKARHQTPAEPSPPLGTAIPDVRHSGSHLTESPKIPTIEVEGMEGGRSEYFIDVTPMRNAIARNMRQSVTEIPHAWTMIEVDVTNIVLRVIS